MSGEEPAVCSRCVAAMLWPSSFLRVRMSGLLEAAMTAEEVDRLSRSPDVRDKIALVRRAWANKWDVDLNNCRVLPPVTTWQGDPVCQWHLAELAEAERQPRTVRMAQWGPRSGR